MAFFGKLTKRIRKLLGFELTEFQKKMLEGLSKNPNAHLIRVGKRGGLYYSDERKMVWGSEETCARNQARISLGKSNVEELEHAEECGCFNCLSVFNPSEVNQPDKYSVNLLCPNCGSPTVVVFHKTEIERNETLIKLNKWMQREIKKENIMDSKIVKREKIDGKNIFYIEIPDTMSDKEVNDFIEDLKEKYHNS